MQTILQPFSDSLNFLQPLSSNFRPYHDLLLQFLNSFPRLTTLNLSHDSLTDAILWSITQSCAGLLNFDNSHNYFLTDSSLFNLAANCKQLQTLDIKFNNLFTRTALISLSEGCCQIIKKDVDRTYLWVLTYPSVGRGALVEMYRLHFTSTKDKIWTIILHNIHITWIEENLVTLKLYSCLL